MEHVSATSFRTNLYAMMERVIRYNSPLKVSTKAGRAVVISEDEYNAINETLYLSNSPKTHEEIITGLQTPLEECITLDGYTP